MTLNCHHPEDDSLPGFTTTAVRKPYELPLISQTKYCPYYSQIPPFPRLLGFAFNIL
jgi:hypothetical protein